MPEKTEQPAEWVAPHLVRLGTVGQVTALGGSSGSDLGASSGVVS
jgi:hypothetical protein